MNQYSTQLSKWLATGLSFCSATVIHTWGSSPRPVGSMMFIGSDAEILGSVSGGCVEGAVVREALEVMKTGKAKHLKFGITDDEAWAVGLSCGGSMAVFLEPFVGIQNPEIWSLLSTDNPCCTLATLLSAENTTHVLVTDKGEVIGHSPTENLQTEALRAYRERKTQTITLENDTWLLQVFPRQSQLIIVGAAHITVDLVHLAQYFDFETIVIDPRGIFAHKTQFPTPPDHLFVDWPAEVLPNFKLDAYTFAVLLTHDPKIDDQALELFLKSEVAYIGCLGSKKTHEKRINRLTAKGFSETDIARIHAPVGVDIRAKSAKEIALSIVSELVRERNQYL